MAWSSVTQTPLASHEIKIIEDLDDYFISQERKERARLEKQNAQKHKRKR